MADQRASLVSTSAASTRHTDVGLPALSFGLAVPCVVDALRGSERVQQRGPSCGVHPDRWAVQRRAGVEADLDAAAADLGHGRGVPDHDVDGSEGAVREQPDTRAGSDRAAFGCSSMVIEPAGSVETARSARVHPVTPVSISMSAHEPGQSGPASAVTRTPGVNPPDASSASSRRPRSPPAGRRSREPARAG